MRRSKQNYRDFKRAFRAHMDKAKQDFHRDWEDTMSGVKDSYDDRPPAGGEGTRYGKQADAQDRFGRKEPSRSRFYLDKRNARLLGVCAGIADYTGISTFWVRLAFVLIVLFGFPPLFFGYFIVAFIADEKPKAHYQEAPEEQEFWRNVRTRPHTTVRDVRLRFKDMERRLRDMERYVTSNSRRLNSEINALRD